MYNDITKTDLMDRNYSMYVKTPAYSIIKPVYIGMYVYIHTYVYKCTPPKCRGLNSGMYYTANILPHF